MQSQRICFIFKKIGCLVEIELTAGIKNAVIILGIHLDFFKVWFLICKIVLGLLTHPQSRILGP